MRTICLYHANCIDGVTAAWVVWLACPGAEFYPMGYKDKLPTCVEGAHLIIVDYTLEVEHMREAMASAEKITLIDHHPRARDQVIELGAHREESGKQHTGVFNSEKSGALLAWMHFFPEEEPPMVLRYISDYDTNQHKFQITPQVIMSLSRFQLKLDVWKTLGLSRPDITSELVKDASVLEEQFTTLYMAIIEQTQRTMVIGGYEVPVINIPKIFSTRAITYLAENTKAPFAAGYFDADGFREYSLRSIKGVGIEVNAIAREYGGDGHPHAAGFRVDRSHFMAKE